MQALDLFAHNPLAGPGAIARLRERIETMGKEVPRDERSRILGLLDATESPDATAGGATTDGTVLDGERLRDAISTRLMECFRLRKGRATFGLLYELNGSHLLGQVASRLRRYSSKADPGDVLQEVFFNVYRYPHRFDATRDDAFRVWSAMIVRNTVLKHMRSQSRGGRGEVPFEDLSDQPVASDQNPLHGVLQDESRASCSRVYVTYLQLYLEFYGMLSERERKALHLVEVDGVSYRTAAADLGIKLENLKMVIFRARRKIHRAMRRVFDGLSPDCRPAREPSRGEPAATPSRAPRTQGEERP